MKPQPLNALTGFMCLWISYVVVLSCFYCCLCAVFISWLFINEGASSQSVFSIITGAQFMVDMPWVGDFFKQQLHILQSIPNLFLVGPHWVLRSFMCVCVCVAFYLFIFFFGDSSQCGEKGSIMRQRQKSKRRRRRQRRRAHSEDLGWTQTQDVMFTPPQASRCPLS